METTQKTLNDPDMAEIAQEFLNTSVVIDNITGILEDYNKRLTKLEERIKE